MTGNAARVGSVAWASRTGGTLSGAEKRQLVAPLARAHVDNAVGRTAMALRLHSGRRVQVPERALRTPPTALTKAAEQVARQRLTPAVLNHSYRCYSYGVAIAALEDIDVDRELLFAAAMLHDTGLSAPAPGVDFTVVSAGIALKVAENVGLSTAATETMRTAIMLHYSPDVTLADGPEAYLLSAGAAVDVIGLGGGKLPDSVGADVLAERPRRGFKNEAPNTPYSAVSIRRSQRFTAALTSAFNASRRGPTAQDQIAGWIASSNEWVVSLSRRHSHVPERTDRPPGPATASPEEPALVLPPPRRSDRQGRCHPGRMAGPSSVTPNSAALADRRLSRGCHQLGCSAPSRGDPPPAEAAGAALRRSHGRACP
jgi:HD domain